MVHGHRVLLPKKKPDNRESTSRADGASLAMGSSEYRERVMDLMGMDKFEQEDSRLEAAGFREDSDFKPEDAQAKAYADKVASFAKTLDKTFGDVHGDILSPAELKTAHEIRKSLLVDDAVAGAAAAAALTEDKADDKYVSHKLPKRLEKAVYDEGKDEEDIYPGMSTLEKYM